MTTLVMAIAVLMRVGPGGPHSTGFETMTRILGDSVVPLPAAPLSDTMKSHEPRWLDTLHIVEFVLRGPSIRAASVLGDFNRWQRNATPLVSDGHGNWRARALVPRDALAMAYLVNDLELVGVTTRR